jgi:SAM-dependent methyltransferase
VTVFKDYAEYYDLLNSDKDYITEADYIYQLIQSYSPGAKTVLDLGCGTGSYELALAAYGFDLTGLDLSEEMLSVARERCGNLCQFLHGDMRKIRLGRIFDIVISLFHVMSYQLENKDLLSSVQTAYEHLNFGGLFIFDFWHGPGVLIDPPVIRKKLIDGYRLRVSRKATPNLIPQKHRVDILYDVDVEEIETGTRKSFQELHSVRYLFVPELNEMLQNSGFSVIGAFEWMKRSPLKNSKSWNGIVIARKDATQCG